MISSLLNDILTHKEFEGLRQNKEDKSETCKNSCMKNVMNLSLEEYVLSVCIEMLLALTRNKCPATLSRSVINAYLFINVLIQINLIRKGLHQRLSKL